MYTVPELHICTLYILLYATDEDFRIFWEKSHYLHVDHTHTSNTSGINKLTESIFS